MATWLPSKLLSPTLKAVHLAGNHERQVLQLSPNAGFSDRFARSELGQPELDWMGGLNHTHNLNEQVLLCHGAPDTDNVTLLQSAERPATAAEVEQRLDGHFAELILCGHTHVARSVRTSRGGLIGLQAYYDDYPHPHVVESGSPDARYAIVERGSSGWAAAMFTVPYPHQKMAELARLRNCLDWERALLTGYMQ